jgi:hypothetical protein
MSLNMDEFNNLPMSPWPSGQETYSTAIVRLQKPTGWNTSIEYEDVEVRVMAVTDGYAMVSRKGCAPFVIESKRLMPVGH